MRGLILAVILSAALHAQASQGSPEPDKQGSPEPARPGTGFLPRHPPWKLFPDLKSLPARPPVQPPARRITLKPGQPCAIPLVTVVPRDVDPKMIVAPRRSVESKVQTVRLPAPSCDDVKLR